MMIFIDSINNICSGYYGYVIMVYYEFRGNNRRNCSRNIHVKIVWGPSLVNDGTKPCDSTNKSAKKDNFIRYLKES